MWTEVWLSSKRSLNLSMANAQNKVALITGGSRGIGKSTIEKFENSGGQNPLEAARFGCNILHGPNVSNFAEIYQFLKSKKMSNYFINFVTNQLVRLIK